MSRLFHANLMRLRKSRIFLLGELAATGYALLVYGSAGSRLKSGGTIEDWNMYFFNVLLVIGIAIALFVTVFLHAEYSQGTVRDKLAVGHKRRDVYLANYAVCALAGLCMYVTYLLSGILFGLLLFGKMSLRLSAPVPGCLFGGAAVVSYTAIFVLVEMLVDSKTVSAAGNVLGAGLLLMLGMMCYVKLVNPGDKAGFVWNLIEMFCPSSAAFYTAAVDRELPARVILALLAEAACLTGIGVWGFGRKDIQ